MTDQGHPDVPEQIFDEEDRTVERRWQVYLQAVQPAEVYAVHHSIFNEDYKDDLDELDLIPENVTLNTLSFYTSGTYREAYMEAQEMCDELNEERNLAGSEWEFERGSIMKVEG